MQQLRPFCSALLFWGACSSSSESAVDASTGNGEEELDGGAPLDGREGVFADFTVSGCTAAADFTHCDGTAPLTVNLVAVNSAGVDTQQWSLGDGARATGPVLTHTFELPGEYDVTFSVRAAGGSDSLTRLGFIRALAVPAGGPCDRDGQCADGFCACSSDTEACAVPLDEGLCTSDCTSASCAQGDVCVQIGADVSELPWQGTLCLQSCGEDEDCTRAGFDCRDLPATSEVSGWSRGCFPPLLSDLGEPCGADSGLPTDSKCAGGLCAAVGSVGLCTADCSTRSCPTGSGCATFLGEPRCLRSCSSFGCDDDPLLGCEPANPAGDFGFELGDEDTYCAPKRCSDSSDCGPFGDCDLDAGGFCVASS